MKWIRGLSIRTRITLGTLVVALVLSTAAGFLLNLKVASIINETTVQLLHDDSAPFEAAIRRDPTAPAINAAEGQLVALVNPAGHITLTNLPDALTDRLAMLKTFDQTPRPVGNDGKAYLVLTERVNTPAGQWKIIVGRSSRPGQLVIDQLRNTLIVGAAILFIAFGITSWVLSGAALRPVARMRREAEQLGQADLAGVLPIGPARDELSALAMTLNDLLERNRLSLDRERQLLSDASHELRTPLAVVIAQLDELAAAARDHRDSSASVDDALATARRLANLTTNILELSKLEAGEGQASSAWPALVQELSGSTDRARIVAHTRGVDVDFHVTEGDAADHYAVSAANFGRLVDNLFSNAISAMSSEQAVVGSLTRGPAAATLVVADEGHGMPEDFIPVALDRFSRPDDSRGEDGGGSGLGLAIVAAIVAAGGGQIAIENTHPGLRVTVVIPAIEQGSVR